MEIKKNKPKFSDWPIFWTSFLSIWILSSGTHLGEKSPSFYDDINAYGINLITRTLLDIVAAHAIREGDSTFIKNLSQLTITRHTML